MAGLDPATHAAVQAAALHVGTKFIKFWQVEFTKRSRLKPTKINRLRNYSKSLLTMQRQNLGNRR